MHIFAQNFRFNTHRTISTLPLRYSILSGTTLFYIKLKATNA
jgi:hypothetical protein